MAKTGKILIDPTKPRYDDFLNIPVVKQLPDQEANKFSGIMMRHPVRIGLRRDNSDLWTLPIEPLVRVAGGNVIIKRTIAKRRGIGSVKELWTQNDYRISIRGFIYSGNEKEFPQSDLSLLKGYLTATKSLVISSKLTDVFGISLLAVEDYDFPETPGVAWQEYVINGYSDYDFELT